MDLFAPIDAPGGIAPLAPPSLTSSDGATPTIASTADLTALRNQLDVQEQQILNNWYTQYRRCIFCQKTYLEIDNLGQWQCAQYISGVVNTAESCSPTVIPQLVRADHRWLYNPVRWAPMDDQVLSQALANYLQAGRHLNAQSIITTTKGKGCAGISRFDKRAADSFYEACSGYTSPARSCKDRFPFNIDCGPVGLRAVRPYLVLHDQLYNAATEDTVVRRTPAFGLRRTIGSVSDSDRLVVRRLQLQRAKEERERARQARNAARRV